MNESRKGIFSDRNHLNAVRSYDSINNQRSVIFKYKNHNNYYGIKLPCMTKDGDNVGTSAIKTSVDSLNRKRKVNRATSPIWDQNDDGEFTIHISQPVIKKEKSVVSLPPRYNILKKEKIKKPVQQSTPKFNTTVHDFNAEIGTTNLDPNNRNQTIYKSVPTELYSHIVKTRSRMFSFRARNVSHKSWF